MQHQSQNLGKKLSQDQQSKQTFLILIYGLPASGKSTFGQWIKKQYFPDALLISGDSIERMIKQDKNYVKHLGQLTPQNLIGQLKKISNTEEASKIKPQFSPQNWKQSRKLIEQLVEKMIDHVSIILDDDFLLRSQRKVYRKKSWKHQIKYLQIFLDTPINTCLENLKKRSKQNNDCVITEQTVTKAAQKLQNDNQASYSIKLDFDQRKNITKADIDSKFKIVQIHPNDPNDPEYHIQKPKHEHSKQELLQLQIRAFINSVMKLSQQQFQQMYGKKMGNKKQLGNQMNEWKKAYMKSPDKSMDIEEINKNFIEYLKK